MAVVLDVPTAPARPGATELLDALPEFFVAEIDDVTGILTALPAAARL